MSRRVHQIILVAAHELKEEADWLVDWMVNTNELNANKNQKFMLSIFDDTNATDQRY